jgi:hypothetical protein
VNGGRERRAAAHGIVRREPLGRTAWLTYNYFMEAARTAN